MDYEDPWIFRARGGNKKAIEICPEERPFTLSDEHFKVIEEYGVQFDVE
ncbi:8782_t:CDS:2, partial [Diversispora eburnea]